MKKLNPDFMYLKDMYNDDYYPRFLVDKVKDCIVEVVEFLEKEDFSLGNGVKEYAFKEKEEYTKLKDYYFEYRDNDNSKRTYEYIISKGY